MVYCIIVVCRHQVNQYRGNALVSFLVLTSSLLRLSCENMQCVKARGTNTLIIMRRHTGLLVNKVHQKVVRL